MMVRSDESVLELNIAEFLAEYFLDVTGTEYEFSYGMFWDAVVADRYNGEKINIFTGNKQKRDGSFYYEYGLLKAEEEMEAEQPVTEKLISGVDGRKLYSYNIHYENPDEKPVSFYFYTRTRIMAFIQHENETLEVAWEMQEITQQKPILCLESHTRLFRGALDSILEAYSKGEYSDEDLRKEHCPDVTEVYTDWMRYKFRCSNEYEAYMLMVGDVEGNNVCNAIDAAWNWLHTGFVNNFISRDPESHSLNLNW